MSGRLAGRAFVVEGAFPDGDAVAKALVAQGARVLVVASDEAAARAVAAPLGDAAFALAADLASAEGADAVGTSVPIVLGRLDGALVRPTASRGEQGTVADLDDDAWRRACSRLVEAPARIVRELAPHLEDGGTIVLVEPPTDGDANEVLLPALRALVEALDASFRPAVRVQAAACERDALLAALTS